MNHKKDKEPARIEPGDIVSLPHLGTDTLAFAITGSHKGTRNLQLEQGLYYLTIRILKSKGKNEEGVFYHLSPTDLEEIEAVTGKDYRLDKFKLRMEYGAHFYKLAQDDEDAGHNIFFIKYASSYGTKFGKLALEHGVRDVLTLQGIGLDPQQNPYVPQTLPRKAPETVVKTRKPSEGAILDISLEDAYLRANLFLDKRVYEALKTAGITRLSEAQKLSATNYPDLEAAWKTTARRTRFSVLQDEVKEAHTLFLQYMADQDSRTELEQEKGIKLNYPPLKL